MHRHYTPCCNSYLILTLIVLGNDNDWSHLIAEKLKCWEAPQQVRKERNHTQANPVLEFKCWTQRISMSVFISSHQYDNVLSRKGEIGFLPSSPYYLNHSISSLEKGNFFIKYSECKIWKKRNISTGKSLIKVVFLPSCIMWLVFFYSERKRENKGQVAKYTTHIRRSCSARSASNKQASDPRSRGTRVVKSLTQKDEQSPTLGPWESVIRAWVCMDRWGSLFTYR